MHNRIQYCEQKRHGAIQTGPFGSQLLGYTEWRNFSQVVDKARTACANAGQDVRDHFVDVNRMIDAGKAATREINDLALSRCASYLITQNGLMTGQIRVADLDIDTSEVTDQFPDVGKMVGEVESPMAADHFAEVGKMVRDASSLESVIDEHVTGQCALSGLVPRLALGYRFR